MSVSDKFHEDNTDFKSQSLLWLNSKYKAQVLTLLKNGVLWVKSNTIHVRTNEIFAEASTI